MVKVFIKSIELGAISAGASEIFKIGNKRLAESTLQKSLPVLGLNVANTSPCTIDVVINHDRSNFFRVSPNADRSLTGIPITDIEVFNISAVDNIASGQVLVTMFNDLEACKLYIEGIKAQFTQVIA